MQLEPISSLYNDDILISLIYMYMETNLSRSCADLKGVGGWVGGGGGGKFKFFTPRTTIWQT